MQRHDLTAITLYHGTDEDSLVFEKDRIAYFSDDRDGAGRYGENIIAVSVTIKNPYIHDDTLFNPSRSFIDNLRQKGHDGIISMGEDEGELYYIVFSGEQVTSHAPSPGAIHLPPPARLQAIDAELNPPTRTQSGPSHDYP